MNVEHRLRTVDRMERRTLAATTVAVALVIAATPPARAEYAELQMAKELATYTWLGFGTAAVVLDGLSVWYLKRGQGPETGRKVVAGLQMVDAALLVASGLTWLGLSKQARQGPDGAMYVLTGVHLALGAASAGLGVATYLSHATDPLLGHLTTVGVAPLATATSGIAGVTLLAGGRF
jgi:hypothetical protein